MKRYGLLIVWTTMSSWSFSQGLSPQIQIIENDTLFCFTIGQSKTIARHLTKSAYCDSVESEYERKIALLNKINNAKDITIINLEGKIINLNLIVDNNDQSIGTLQKLVATKDKKLRNSRIGKKLLTLGLAIAGTIAIIK